MELRKTGLYTLFAVLAILPACSPGKAPQGIDAGVRPGESIAQTFPLQNVVRLRGRVMFERVRAVTDPAGLNPTAASDIAPARFVDVVALDAAGAEVQAAPAGTGEDGKFEVQVPRGVAFRLAVFASTRNSGGRVNLDLRDPVTTERVAFTFNDPLTGAPFSFPTRFGIAEVVLPAIPLTPNSSPPRLTDRPAGAFNLIDTLVNASEKVRVALGTPPPLLTVFWAPDISLGSFFVDTFPPFGRSLFIQGGDPVRDNTDELDPSVISHEFGHFVASAFLRDSSLGGVHGVTDVLYPSLAFSEGYANAFSGMVLDQAAYVDSAAILATSKLFFALNLENRDNSFPPGGVGAQRGIRSEISVGEILWDVVDGTGAKVDTDSDGVAVPFDVYLRALANLHDKHVYLSVEDAFQALVDAGAVSQSALQGLLSAPVNQQISFPAAGTDVFPSRLGVPGVAFDTCQTRGLFDPVSDGVDVSSRFFEFTLPAPATVSVTLTLLGGVTGRGINSTNVDLLLRTVDNQLATDTAGAVVTPDPGPDGVKVETTGRRLLAAGTYVVQVSGRPADAAGFKSNIRGGINVPYRLEVTSP